MPTTAIKAKPRERLVESGRRLFFEKGYALVGVNEIIADASVAKASFYKHFPSKDDLIVACLDRDHQEAVNALRSSASSIARPYDRILTVFDAAAAFQEQSAFRGCHFTNALASLGDSIPRVRTLAQLHIDALTNLYAEHAKAWEVDQGHNGIDIDCLARALTSLLQGAVLRAQVSRETNAFEEAKICAKAMLKCAADNAAELF